MLPCVDDLEIKMYPPIADGHSKLHVYEHNARNDVPFTINRVFVVSTGKATRGNHAHRQCQQLLICLQGICKVTCHDGNTSKIFKLDSPDSGLLIPAGIWAKQEYLATENILQVICDLPYEENDYIRDFAEFKQYRI